MSATVWNGPSESDLLHELDRLVPNRIQWTEAPHGVDTPTEALPPDATLQVEWAQGGGASTVTDLNGAPDTRCSGRVLEVPTDIDIDIDDGGMVAHLAAFVVVKEDEEASDVRVYFEADWDSSTMTLQEPWLSAANAIAVERNGELPDEIRVGVTGPWAHAVVTMEAAKRDGSSNWLTSLWTGEWWADELP